MPQHNVTSLGLKLSLMRDKEVNKANVDHYILKQVVFSQCQWVPSSASASASASARSQLNNISSL